MAATAFGPAHTSGGTEGRGWGMRVRGATWSSQPVKPPADTENIILSYPQPLIIDAGASRFSPGLIKDRFRNSMFMTPPDGTSKGAPAEAPATTCHERVEGWCLGDTRSLPSDCTTLAGSGARLVCALPIFAAGPLAFCCQTSGGWLEEATEGELAAARSGNK